MAAPVSPKNERYIELDLLRTVAIAMMVLYHLAYDLETFYGWKIGLSTSPWEELRIATATLFLLLAGIGSMLTGKPFRRATTILAASVIVSAATYVFEPETYVRFGILHLIGVSTLLLACVGRWKGWNVCIGMIIVIAASTLDDVSHIFDMTSYRYFLSVSLPLWIGIPLGFPPPGFTTIDFYPLLPWSGVIFIGAGLGHYLFVHDPARKRFLPTVPSPLSSVLAWPGRHALAVYLIHQPIMLGILWSIRMLIMRS